MTTRTKGGCFVWLLSAIAFVLAAPAWSQHILVEAESFEDHGGWVLDQQFMDQMGSPFLLAHGLGEPVADAITQVELSAPATYRVWVRTRDWAAPWNPTGDPGRFQILIDGVPLDTTFGTERSDWHWQDGGTAHLHGASVLLALHDLAGFEGRCDAVLLTSDLGFVPPNVDPIMRYWRRNLLDIPSQPDVAGEFDLVVVGGGTAGMCASLVAARQGLTVALVQDRPVVGGNNSSEVRVWLNGETNFDPYPRIGDVMREFEPARRAHAGPGNTAEIYEDEKRAGILTANENLRLFLNTRINEVRIDGSRIAAVIGQDIRTGRRLLFEGRWFADCTGDGCVGYLAGADYDITLDGHMGRSNLWNIRDTGSPAPFPRCPWAVDLSDKPFPSSEHQLGTWFWEAGFYHDPFKKSEYIRDLNLRAMYGAWDALKNVRGQFPNHKLNWAAYISGKRESRRLLGDVILTKEDFTGWVEYPDACVPTTWSIDLHLPDPAYDNGFEGDEFISRAYYTHYDEPYWIPYRCLYSRNIDNLFMAGRDISVTHEALGAVRVMRTGGMMGEIVGLAAGLCKKYDTDPRGVYASRLSQLQKLMGRIVVQRWLDRIGSNLALSASVSVSSDYNPTTYPSSNINDGRVDIKDNSQRWLSAAGVPQVVDFAWDEPQTISAVRILSGWYSGGRTQDPINDFQLMAFQDGQWIDVEDSAVSGNTSVEILKKFPAVRTSRLRLLITATHTDIARIWEVEFYHPAADLNEDGQVNLADIAELAGVWLRTGEALPADLDLDERIDLADFGYVSEFWHWPGS